MRPRGGAGARDMPPAHQIDAAQTTVVAGAVAHLLSKAVAGTGVLDRFASGRNAGN